MSVEDWVAIFTGVQTIAVVSGLVFVSVQLRDARRISSGGAYQNWLNTMLGFFGSLANDAKLATLYWRGRKDISSLTEDEIAQFFYLCVTYFVLVENLYVQHGQGLIPEEVFLPWQHGFVEGIKGSGFVEYWRLESAHYDPSFRAFVNDLLLDRSAEEEDTKLSAFWSLVNTSSSIG